MDLSNLWYLENVNLFELFCPVDDSMSMPGHQSKKTFKKGEFIYFMNDLSNRIYFLEKGKVKIGSYSEDGKEITKVILTPGEMFGEMGLVGEDKRKDFAQAIDGDVSVCVMTADEMNELMKSRADFTIHLTKHIGSRLMKTERRLESLVFKDARSRVIEFLFDLGKEKGTVKNDITVVDDFYTHQEIANLTGTSRQTVTTVLNELREVGLIDFDRKLLSVKSLSDLKNA
jgi:CRP/FNR family transcriptional regulator, cyclic AMP receptor protein